MSEVESISTKNVILAACIMTAASIVITASSSYMLDPMARDFNLSSSEADILKFIPTLATIVVVFLAGVLGDRLGHRRVTLWGTTAFTIGGLGSAIAINWYLEVISLSILGAGASIMTVNAMATMSKTVTGAKDRAKAFGTLGAMSPFVYLLAPILAGLLVTYASWRWMSMVFAILGVVAAALATRLLPRERGNRNAGELITPTLAGISLMLITLMFNVIDEQGLMSTEFLLTSTLAVLTVMALLIARRRLKETSLSFGPVERRKSLLLLLAVILIPLASMWYTTYLLFEYLYGLTALQISFVMLPSQIVGVLAARVGSGLIIRLKLLKAGMVAYGISIVAQLGFLLLGPDQLPFAIALTAFFSFTACLTGVVMSNSVMDSAPKSESGSMASFKAASSRVGAALGSLVIGTVVLSTYTASLDQVAAVSNVTVPAADAISQALLDPENTGQMPYVDSTTEVAKVSEMQKVAMLDSLDTKAVFGSVVMVLAGGAFVLGMRRRDEGFDHEHAPETVSAT